MFKEVIYDDLMDAFKCELCGEWHRNLSFHIRKHKMSVAEYKEMFGINKSTPINGYEFRKRKAELAEGGKALGKYLGRNSPTIFKKGDNTKQKYKRRPETKQFLKKELPIMGVEARRK